MALCAWVITTVKQTMLTVLKHGIRYQLVAKSQLALLIHTLQF